MEVIATQKYLRMSARKIRPVVDIIKKLNPESVLDVLPNIDKRSAEPILKVIKTALANAKAQGISGAELIFKEIQISEGPFLKRGQPVSRGRWHPIKKRMSHIRVVLTTEKLTTKKHKKAKTIVTSKPKTTVSKVLKTEIKKVKNTKKEVKTKVRKEKS